VAPLFFNKAIAMTQVSSKDFIRVSRCQVKEFRCPRGTGRYKGRLTEGCDSPKGLQRNVVNDHFTLVGWVIQPIYIYISMGLVYLTEMDGMGRGLHFPSSVGIICIYIGHYKDIELTKHYSGRS